MGKDTWTKRSKEHAGRPGPGPGIARLEGELHHTFPRCDGMNGEDEKRVLRLAERKGFRLEGVGAAEDRYYVIDVASGGKMPSDVPGHPYSFTLQEAKEWLEARENRSGGRTR